MPIDPKDLAAFDQDCKIICETFPPLWFSLYTGCVEEGFTEVQALELVKAYIPTV